MCTAIASDCESRLAGRPFGGEIAVALPTSPSRIRVVTAAGGDLTAVLRALRRRADEAQLTQMLAAFAGADPAFASRCLQVVLAHAPRQDRVGALGTIPAELLCVAENRLHGASGVSKGFVDLRFDDAAGEFSVLVELKLYSGYGHDQLQRYLDGLAVLHAKRAALVAVTRDAPRHGEDVVRDDSRWCGSVRWARLFDELRALDHVDPLLNLAWGTMLDILRADGDFGTMDFDTEAIRGWNRATEGRDRMISILNEISERALEVVRDELAAHRGITSSPPLADFRMIKVRRVWPWKDRLVLQVQIPAGAGERLRIQFLGGFKGGPYFTVEARYPDARSMLADAVHPVSVATRALTDLGFSTGRDWESYWTRLHPPAEWLDAGSAIHDVLLDIVTNDVRELAASGIFEALPQGATALADVEPPTELLDDGFEMP